MFEINWTAVGTAAGGLGLLLLGMQMLTEGLKGAAGKALHHLLGRWTKTRTRGLAAGALITGLVQSSSAVTVAIIGFANAGLMTLPQATWVVFGSNVGTTMTGWLVALVGLKVKVEAFALPALGVGMLMRLIGRSGRYGRIGEAVAGFGALFVGLSLLQETFAHVAEGLDLTAVEQWGRWGLVAAVGAGAIITTLMQSSSAAMAVILTASSEGLFSPAFAASLVIGANLGTTSTALLSTIGATSNARRVAVLHVIFNLVTGVVALLLLKPLLAGIEWLHEWTAAAPSLAVDLALFHTCFNVLGILLMWPTSQGLVRILEKRFLSAEEDTARPRHLDDNVLSVPELAARALLLELRRAGSIGLSLAREVASRTIQGEDAYAARARPVRRLLVEIAEYTTKLNRTGLTPVVADALTGILRAHGHLWTLLRVSGDLISGREEVESEASRTPLLLSEEYLVSALFALDAADTAKAEFSIERCRTARDEHEVARRREHRRLSQLGISGRTFLPTTNQALQELALDRRMVARAWNLAAALHVVEMGLEQSTATGSKPSSSEARLSNSDVSEDTHEGDHPES